MTEAKDYSGRALGSALTDAGQALIEMSTALRRYSEHGGIREEPDA
jgi:hypothetical protein